MTVDEVITLGQRMLEISLIVGTPVLLTTFIVGIVISIIQAATQIHEMTLTFIPKILATLLVIFVLGSWMFIKLVEYTKQNFQYLLSIVK
ncbi:flagellar biosynthetic protein FliQ [Balnearium lithotrophicum]|jgi:flagellar biosynthetic protein FliQ|uniref:Flagellar biosynthetic protein FliQ n=1 Tax=Balnearium lithotrophicum TaxID=223788 RepID=A0A521CC21_9BACT|nr:flagellar biosynthesis protein FliQ [Balnearium lithotrophicum]SMO56351.1 flagellar biosynthetic protein FliQ [Balnearium lithotrophicum]